MMAEVQTATPTPKMTPGCRRCAYFETQAKGAIRQRDALDKTILAMDGGVGHWRRVAKEFGVQLNHIREERNKQGVAGEPGRLNDRDMQVLFGARRDEDMKRLASLTLAAADREADVERRVSAARDKLYELMNRLSADAQVQAELRQVWATL